MRSATGRCGPRGAPAPDVVDHERPPLPPEREEAVPGARGVDPGDEVAPPAGDLHHGVFVDVRALQQAEVAAAGWNRNQREAQVESAGCSERGVWCVEESGCMAVCAADARTLRRPGGASFRSGRCERSSPSTWRRRGRCRCRSVGAGGGQISNEKHILLSQVCFCSSAGRSRTSMQAPRTLTRVRVCDRSMLKRCPCRCDNQRLLVSGRVT